jgi:hypothetical protein
MQIEPPDLRPDDQVPLFSGRCGGFTHGNAEKLKFCFLKIGKSNYERLVLLNIVTKTAGSDMLAVGSGEKENAPN